MNFVDIIKRTLNDPESHRGFRGKTVVDTEALIQLVKHFDRMESIDRLQHNKKNNESIRHTLAEALEAVYRSQGQESDLTMEIVMHVLKPLIEERHQQKIALIRY